MAEKILIVDDDLDTLRLVGLMLQRQGYEILAASSGPQALSLAQEEKPDLILLDVMMPGMDGVEVTRRLRADPNTKDLPVIMFTAKAQVEDKLLGFEAGVDDYLTKPTQPRELAAHVKAVLARVKKSQEPGEATARDRGFTIGIAAARGGLGVSTLALNLGVSLAAVQKQGVIVADFRPGQGTISLELGQQQPDGLNRLLQRKPVEITVAAIEQELVQHSSGARFLLASPQPREAQWLAALPQMEAVARQLAHLAQFVILDLGPSLSPVVEKALPHCDEIILVTDPLAHTIVQTKAFIDDLVGKGVGDGRIQVVLVNRIRSEMQLTWSQVQEQLKRNIALVFTPAPELAHQASKNNRSMIAQQPESLTAMQFNKLAERIVQSYSKPGT